MKEKHVWRIEGFDGTELIFEREVPLHLLSDRQMEEVLRRLVSRYLSESEIVGASLNQKAERTSFLDVRRSMQPPHLISCGENPHYIARVVRE
ncbi:MAG: hypothetical protein KDB22_28290 [Planctomycetales bacterium]|nr:hypothetical protein [Planctomycetales bacterium]MCB1448549.1 hypothetical protein [Nitratireductor sp.]